MCAPFLAECDDRQQCHRAFAGPRIAGPRDRNLLASPALRGTAYLFAYDGIENRGGALAPAPPQFSLATAVRPPAIPGAGAWFL